jgi:Protein of unknown function (DUF3108)
MSDADRRVRGGRRHAWLAAFAAVAFATAGAAGADSLRAHEISYRFSFRGMGGGDLQLSLRAGSEPDSWIYETRPFPSMLARLVVSPESRERSWFTIAPTGVQPQRYVLEDGSGKKSENTELTYDWARSRVHGIARGAPLDIATEAGLQDVMSIRAAPVVDLLAGREPKEYAMLDGSEVKHFVYTRVGPEKLKTALGELDTVVFTSMRKGSDAHDRTWRYWYAPSYGWVPVRIEQRQDGETRLAFAVRSFKWLDAPPAASGVAPH